MPTEDERALSTAHRRRGVVRASITRLDGRVVDLESKRELTADDVRSAQHLLQKLNTLEADFKTYHLSIVDLLDEDALEASKSSWTRLTTKLLVSSSVCIDLLQACRPRHRLRLPSPTLDGVCPGDRPTWTKNFE